MHIFTLISADDITLATTSNRQNRLFNWMYTAAFYVLSYFVYYDLIYTKRILKPYMDNPTMDSVNYVLITSLSICIVLINPLLASRAHENREKYVQLWREYQVPIIEVGNLRLG